MTLSNDFKVTPSSKYGLVFPGSDSVKATLDLKGAQIVGWSPIDTHQNPWDRLIISNAGEALLAAKVAERHVEISNLKSHSIKRGVI